MKLHDREPDFLEPIMEEPVKLHDREPVLCRVVDCREVAQLRFFPKQIVKTCTKKVHTLMTTFSEGEEIMALSIYSRCLLEL